MNAFIINYFFLLSFGIQHGQNFISYTVLRGSDRTQRAKIRTSCRRRQGSLQLPATEGSWRRNGCHLELGKRQGLTFFSSSAKPIVQSPTLGPEESGPSVGRIVINRTVVSLVLEAHCKPDHQCRSWPNSIP